MDFGRTAGDYARYRTTFPPSLFARLAAMGVGIGGQRVVDLGTGTGVLARGFTAAGCEVTGVDISPELLDEARRHSADGLAVDDRASTAVDHRIGTPMDCRVAAAEDCRVGTAVDYRLAAAEDTGLPGAAWDVVSAGQCWHWFDRPRVAAEALRLLVAGGALVVCYRDYVVLPGNVCAASEDLVLAYNPGWPMVGFAGGPEWTVELMAAGFHDVAAFAFEIGVPFSHEAWRGRMRSSNGVGASLTTAEVAAFDTDLARLLRERFPNEPLVVPHRIWALIARRAGSRSIRPVSSRAVIVL